MYIVAEQLKQYARTVIETQQDIFCGINNMPRVPVVVIDRQGRSIEAVAAFPMSIFTAEGVMRGVTKETKRDPDTRNAVANGQEWNLRDHDVLGAYVFDPLSGQPLLVQERRTFSLTFSWVPSVITAESEPLNLIITNYGNLREGVGPIRFNP